MKSDTLRFGFTFRFEGFFKLKNNEGMLVKNNTFVSVSLGDG